MIRLKDTSKVIQGLTINIGSGLVLTEDADGLPHLMVTGASIPNPLVIPPVTNLITIRTDTGDGGDTASMRLGSGGDILNTRGAFIELHGNEWAGGGAGDAMIVVGTPALAKFYIKGGYVRHENATGSLLKHAIYVSQDQTWIAENAYYNAGWYSIQNVSSTGKAAIIGTRAQAAGYALYVEADNVARAADVARSFSAVFRVDLLGNTDAVGSASNTGKLKGNRFILPIGTDKWAT